MKTLMASAKSMVFPTHYDILIWELNVKGEVVGVGQGAFLVYQ